VESRVQKPGLACTPARIYSTLTHGTSPVKPSKVFTLSPINNSKLLNKSAALRLRVEECFSASWLEKNWQGGAGDRPGYRLAMPTEHFGRPVALSGRGAGRPRRIRARLKNPVLRKKEMLSIPPTRFGRVSLCLAQCSASNPVPESAGTISISGQIG